MPNLFHQIALHMEYRWAEFCGNHIRALQIMKEIAMADLTALTAAVDRVVAKDAADKDALAAAVAENASLQPDIDAQTARLDAIAPVEPVIEPPVLDLNPNA